MAVSISNAFVTLFDSEVKQAYQGQRLLAGVTRERNGVEGSTVKFPKIGKGSATIRVPQTDVTPLNVTYSQVTATMADYIAAEYSDIFNQQKVNFNERQELVQVVSGAIARRMDQVVLDAIAATSTTAIANTVGGGGSAADLNVAKLRAAKKTLDAKNVPAEGRTILVHANNLSSLLSETEVTSSDFNSVKALLVIATKAVWQSTVLATVQSLPSIVTQLALVSAWVSSLALTIFQRRLPSWLRQCSLLVR
jgi:hypothetical protein